MEGRPAWAQNDKPNWQIGAGNEESKGGNPGVLFVRSTARVV